MLSWQDLEEMALTATEHQCGCNWRRAQEEDAESRSDILKGAIVAVEFSLL